MTTLTQAVEGLAAVIGDIPGLRVTDHVPGSTEFPAAFFDWDVIDYAHLDDSGGAIAVDVVLLVGAEMVRHQKKLLPLVYGPDSIQAVLQANRSLGFSDVDAHATMARRLRLEEIAAYQAFGAAVTVQLRLG